MTLTEVVFGTVSLLALLFAMQLTIDIRRNLLVIEEHELKRRLESEDNRRAFLALTFSTLAVSVAIVLGNQSYALGLNHPLARHMGEVGGAFYLAGIIYFLYLLRKGTS